MKKRNFSIDTSKLGKLALKKLPFTLKSVTALLMAMIIVFGLLAFVTSKPMAMVNYRSDAGKLAKENIADYETAIIACQESIEASNSEIEELTAKLPEYEADLAEAEKAVAPAQESLQAAESALDEVCTRSSYSSYFCSADCEQLHNVVAAAKTTLGTANKAVDTCERSISDCKNAIEACEYEINRLNSSIESYQNDIQAQKDKISELRSKSVGAWVLLILKTASILLAMTGLFLLFRILATDTVTKFFLLISCSAVGVGALMLLILTVIQGAMAGITPVLYALLSPYTYTVIAMVMFARIILSKAKRPLVCRTVAIVAAVVGGFAAMVSGSLGGSAFNMLIHLLFAVATICLAFIIEPLVFTEYINIAKHIFLSLITFGVWQAVWTYHVTRNLNCVDEAEERNPRNELLLCIFLPFYYPYWMFKTAEYVEAYGMEKNKSFNLEVLAVVFAFVCPLFATVMIQNKINVTVGTPSPSSKQQNKEI